MPQIVGSVISKCVHGIYLASKQEVRSDKATYCGMCTPEGPYPSQEWQSLVAATPVLKRNFDKASCPSCGSETHYVEGKHWVCSECGNQWKPSRRLLTQSLVSIRSL